MPPPPTVDHRIIETLLRQQLSDSREHRLVLVFAHYDDPISEFTVTDQRRHVRVTDQPSVLGVVDAWHEFLAEHPTDDDVLVITTGVSETQLDWEIRGYA